MAISHLFEQAVEKLPCGTIRRFTLKGHRRKIQLKMLIYYS